MFPSSSLQRDPFDPRNNGGGNNGGGGVGGSELSHMTMLYDLL